MKDSVYKKLCNEHKNLIDNIFIFEGLRDKGTEFSKDVAKKVLPKLNGRLDEFHRIMNILKIEII